MVLKLYGFLGSPSTRYVALIAKELDIKYEFVNVDLANNEHGKPEYKAYQPFGKVPYIVSDTKISSIVQHG
jgi:glutathione S-transferase